jgi:hypothetical protein
MVPLDDGPLSVGSPVWLSAYPPSPTPQSSVPLSPISLNSPFSTASLLRIPAYSDPSSTHLIPLIPRSHFRADHTGNTGNTGNMTP